MVHLRIRMIIDSHEKIKEIECKTLKSSEMSLIIYIETCNREMNTIPTVNPQARKLNFDEKCSDFFWYVLASIMKNRTLKDQQTEFPFNLNNFNKLEILPDLTVEKLSQNSMPSGYKRQSTKPWYFTIVKEIKFISTVTPVGQPVYFPLPISHTSQQQILKYSRQFDPCPR